MKIKKIVFILVTLLFSLNTYSSITMSVNKLNISEKFLEIDHISLERPYLLRTFSADSHSLGTGHSKASKIVYFSYSKTENMLLLFEANKGRVTTNSLDIKRLIAKFPIIEINSHKIIFDFKSGFDHLYSISSYYASDFGEPSKGKHYKIYESVLLKLEKYQDRTSIIQLLHFFENEKRITYKVRFTLQPYKPSNSFIAKKSSNMKQVGYFENHPLILENHGGKVVFTQRINTNKDNTYYISKETPAKYHQAIKDGVQYWNRYFGREILKVKILNHKVDLYEKDYNLIQWVEHSYANGAFADFQTDPITGEILQSAIYLSSSYSFSSKNLLRVLIDNTNNNKAGNILQLNINEFKNNQEGKSEFNMLDALQYLERNIDKIKPSKLLQINQDIIRRVVAHEVGHTIGIRHNFAASVVSNYNRDKVDQALEKYLNHEKDTHDHSIKISSSVMDYFEIKDSILLSLYISNSSNQLQYDKKAIQWGYFNRKLNNLPKLPFCSDSQRINSTYYDCQSHDSGNNPFQVKLEGFKKKINNLAYEFIYFFSHSKNDVDSFKRTNDIKHMMFATKDLIEPIDNIFNDLLKFSHSNTKLQRIEKGIAPSNDYLAEKSTNKTRKLIRDTIKKSDFLLYIRNIFQIGRLSRKWLTDFNNIKHTTTYYNLNNFNEKEMSYIENIASYFFEKLEKKLHEELTTSIALTKSPLDLMPVESFEETMAIIANNIVNRHSSEKITASSNGEQFTFSKPAYSSFVRSSAMKLLTNHVHSTYYDFGVKARAKLKINFNNKYKKTLPIRNQSREFQSFYQQEKYIFNQ